MWFLLVVAILTSGETVGAAAPDQFETEAECQKALAFHAERFKQMPNVAVVNQKCVKVDAPKCRRSASVTTIPAISYGPGRPSLRASSGLARADSRASIRQRM